MNSFQNNLKFGKLPDKSDKIKQEMHNLTVEILYCHQALKRKKKLCLFNPQFPPQHLHCHRLMQKYQKGLNSFTVYIMFYLPLAIHRLKILNSMDNNFEYIK